MNKYYAITTSMTFEKTVLVPVDSVNDIAEAIDRVKCGVQDSEIELLSGDAEFETIQSPYADVNGIFEITDEEAYFYQIVEGYDNAHIVGKACCDCRFLMEQDGKTYCNCQDSDNYEKDFSEITSKCDSFRV